MAIRHGHSRGRHTRGNSGRRPHTGGFIRPKPSPLIGECGPEAILPLKRNEDGNLGVDSTHTKTMHDKNTD